MHRVQNLGKTAAIYGKVRMCVSKRFAETRIFDHLLILHEDREVLASQKGCHMHHLPWQQSTGITTSLDEARLSEHQTTRP